MPRSGKKISPYSPRPEVKSTVIVWAASIVFCLLVVVEVLRLPFDSIGGDPLVYLLAVAVTVAQGLRFFLLSIACQIYIFILVYFARTFPLRPAVALGLALPMGAGFTLHCYNTVSEYGPFGEYFPFKLGFVGLFVFVVAWIVVFILPAPKGGAWKWITTFGVGLLALILTVVSHILNVLLFSGYYECLHAGGLKVTHMLGFMGLASLLAAWGWEDGMKPRVRWTLGSVCVGLIALSLLFSNGSSPAQNQVRSTFFRYSLLGSSIARQVHMDSDGETPVAPSSLNDPKGVERFQKDSGLPPLPDSFHLKDYNILLITLESTRAKGTSFKDPTANRTPFLSEFARRSGSYRFQLAYAASSCTIQAMGSLLALTLPSLVHFDIGPRVFDGTLKEKSVTAQVVLSSVGYNTFWVGHNFHDAFTNKILGFKRGFKTVSLTRRDSKILKLARRHIDKLRSDPQPFFGWVFFEAPHLPYKVHYDDMPRRTAVQRYYQELRYVDEQVEKLIGQLDTWNLLENTVIIIHGDHGEAFGEHGKTTHGTSLYSEQTEIPLVVRVPGMPGGVVEKPVSVNYILPWLFLKGSGQVKELALKRLVEDIGPVLRETGGGVVMELLSPEHSALSLVYPNYRIMYHMNSKYHELYDLIKDPFERTNIITKKTHLSRKAKKQVDAYLRLRRAKKNFGFIHKAN